MLVSLGNLVFRHRNWLFPLVFALARGFSAPLLHPHAPLQDSIRALAGWLIALAGQLLRIITIGHAYIIRGGQNRRVYAEGLVETGVFGACRNPLYVGNLLIALGLAVVINAAAFYALFLVFIGLAYTGIVAAEEHVLRNRFGEQYLAYCARVPRWALRLGKLKDLEWRRFNWRRVVVKEYNTTFGLLSRLCVLGLWRDYMAYGRAALPDAAPLWLAVGLWLLLYAAVRFAKKSGYLQA